MKLHLTYTAPQSPRRASEYPQDQLELLLKTHQTAKSIWNGEYRGNGDPLLKPVDLTTTLLRRTRDIGRHGIMGRPNNRTQHRLTETPDSRQTTHIPCVQFTA